MKEVIIDVMLMGGVKILLPADVLLQPSFQSRPGRAYEVCSREAAIAEGQEGRRAGMGQE